MQAWVPESVDVVSGRQGPECMFNIKKKLVLDVNGVQLHILQEL